MSRKIIFNSILVLLMLLNLPAVIFAAEPEKKEDPFRMKTYEGTIEGKTRANISLQYKADGSQLFEAVIPVNPETKLEGYKKYQEIKEGDMVRVEFKEPYQIDDKGKEVRTGRQATKIRLVRRSEDGKLISRDEE